MPERFFPTITRSSLPQLTTEQMREVDRAMVEDLGINLIQMMENAGRHLAQLARARFLVGAYVGAGGRSIGQTGSLGYRGSCFE